MSLSAEVLQGTIDSVSRPFGNGWRIAKLRPTPEPYTVVGNLGDLACGDQCLFSGKWKDHPKFGRQFCAEYVEVTVPKDRTGIQEYLVRHFRFIGPNIAKDLVESFGDDLFTVMKEEPHRLAQVHGITPARAKNIHDEYLAIEVDRQQDVWFARHGITAGLRDRLVERYETKTKAIEAIEGNPYRLADEVLGIGFKRADVIAGNIGIQPESRRRLNAGILWVLKDACGNEGHTCLPVEDLVSRSCGVLGVRADLVRSVMASLVESGRIVEDGGFVFHRSMYGDEVLISNKIRQLVNQHHSVILSNLTQDQVDAMGEEQQEALRIALSSKISIITGGPGVGKTFTVNKILQALGDRRVALAAPTGKAAKRMSEMTKREAKTIHRLLEFNPIMGGFKRNRDNTIQADTIIIDESSMIDTPLMASLLDAVSKETQVIFVGDVDQLPSVGPGKVFADLVDSGVVPVVRLTQIYRQAAGSLIITNAHRMNRGEKLEIGNADGDDMVLIHEDDASQIPGWIIEAIGRVQTHFEVRLTDIQVLCPQRKSEIGTDSLNKILQPILNPDGAKLKNFRFHVGDRVIQTRNNYDLEVFNGEIGTVQSSTPDDESDDQLWVRFEDGAEEKVVAYTPTQADDLQLAYALTIHKGQGSEFSVVIIPIHTTNYIMLKRNLIYTGITRGKHLVVLVGSKKALNLAVKTVDGSTRWTKLKDRLLANREEAS